MGQITVGLLEHQKDNYWVHQSEYLKAQYLVVTMVYPCWVVQMVDDSVILQVAKMVGGWADEMVALMAIFAVSEQDYLPVVQQGSKDIHQAEWMAGDWDVARVVAREKEKVLGMVVLLAEQMAYAEGGLLVFWQAVQKGCVAVAHWVDTEAASKEQIQAGMKDNQKVWMGKKQVEMKVVQTVV